MKYNILTGGIKCFFIVATLFLSACKSVEHHITDQQLSKSDTPDYIDSNKTRFPLKNYPQAVDQWILPLDQSNHIPVIKEANQKRYFAALLSKYYGMDSQGESPWNAAYITRMLKNRPEQIRDASIRQYLSHNSLSWGENFRINTARWKADLRENSMTPIDALYHASSRAITLRETRVRVLPTDQPAYRDPRKAGEGYPFDALQMSAIRPGTPVYILTESDDKAWLYVTSPAVTGWVKSDDIATVNAAFVSEWTQSAMKHLGAFIQQPVSVHQGKQFYFLARPGTILPFKSHRSGYFSVMIPVRREDGSALIKSVSLRDTVFTAMPWEMTPLNIATLMKSMSGQPYGWGNELFYNDCSSELRSLMMPFGILLPRNSAAQIRAVSRVVDLSKENLQSRIDYLAEHGKAFTTLVYIPGHIMLYIGNRQINGKSVPMTYQNIWGLRPAGGDSRSIIGSAVFFPLLAEYPEKPEMVSLADKTLFKLGFIDAEGEAE